MKKRRILICDDEEKVVQLIQVYLHREGYETAAAYTGRQCLEKVSQFRPDLLILDIMIPEGDGFFVCQEIRKESNLPIIMLTARGEESDRVLGLEIGADDYVVKPFSPRELTARVKATLRRREWDATSKPDRMNYGDLVLDKKERRVFVAGQEVPLTPKEFDLLALMAASPSRVFSRDLLYEIVWGNDALGDVRTVDVHLTRLRSKIEERSDYRYLHTVWGIGYRFEVKQK
ncbi:response regulator transcription factor [Capillibacterium thermochitinicola]|uniref:Response regulator transcription factor n=1 Tax=Capillibacterium thermochitinicola TaxID=2699427 RepID=A0A8J6LHQ0_9FIRM|nr:response regulator transcription factor [Capillibacterium thermochitinicola]MBA2132470.1 response regulator transcription factor [Capillibacterium thermochitinicola]